MNKVEVYTEGKKRGRKKVESYYRLQYEVLKLIDEGRTNEAKKYLWEKVHQQDTDALTIIGFLYFYGVGLKKDEEKGRKLLEEAIRKGNRIATEFIKHIK